MADEAFVLVVGEEVAPAGLDELDTISQSLSWIGFVIDAQRNNIINEALGSFDDIRMLHEDDIDAMSKDFASRTAGNGRMNFGTRRIKLLKAFLHWVKDFYRVSTVPSVDGLNLNSFRVQLNTSVMRAEIRQNLRKQTKTAAEAATPGPLESERKWKEWEEKFINYTRAHLGANGVPLSYVIRDADDPNDQGTFPDFISKTIECAPLEGEYYSADRLSVFNMIVAFTTGQPSGDWIKNTLRFSDGRRSMKALRAHFAGEGNATRNMAEADRLKESLHYKGERSMAFETFLTQCQKMYNIYEKEGEPMTDEAKVRFLYKKVQHSGLRGTIDALKAQQTAGAVITYTMAANHLSTAVSELPEYLSKNRNVSGVATNNSSSDGKGIYDADGKIITGHIPHWRSLSKEERSKVFAERKKLGAKGGIKKGKGNGTPKSDANRMKQLADQNKKYKRQVKALKRKYLNEGDEIDLGEDEESKSDVDAGDQFGGKNSKRKKKD